MSRKKSELVKQRQAQLRQWLRESLAVANLIPADLARLTGLTPDVVSKIMTGERDMQEPEARQFSWATKQPLPELEGFPSPDRPTGRVVEVQVRPVAKATVLIAPGNWREKGSEARMLDEDVALSADPRLRGMRQYVCQLEGQAHFVICVDAADYGSPRPGSRVHVRRTRGSQYEDSVRHVEFTQAGLELQMDGADPIPLNPLPDGVEVKGIVVADHRPSLF